MNRERILHEAGVGLETVLSTATEITADLSSNTSRQQQRESRQKGKNPTNLEFYIPVILTFNSEGEIKTFPGREKLKGFSSRIPALKETVEEVVLQKEENSGLHTGRVSKEWMTEANIQSVLFLTLQSTGWLGSSSVKCRAVESQGWEGRIETFC